MSERKEVVAVLCVRSGCLGRLSSTQNRRRDHCERLSAAPSPARCRLGNSRCSTGKAQGLGKSP